MEARNEIVIDMNQSSVNELAAFRKFITNAIRQYLKKCRQGNRRYSFYNENGLSFHIAAGKNGKQRAADYLVDINLIDDPVTLVRKLYADLSAARQKRAEETLPRQAAKSFLTGWRSIRKTALNFAGYDAELEELVDNIEAPKPALGNSEELSGLILQGLYHAIIQGHQQLINRSLEASDREQLYKMLSEHDHISKLTEFRNNEICLVEAYQQSLGDQVSSTELTYG